MSTENNNKKQPTISNCSYTCSACKKSLSSKGNLARHIKSAHKNDEEILNTLKKKPLKYQCGSCSLGFNHQRNLYYHQRKIHGNAEFHRSVHVCALCSNPFTIKDIIHHLQTEHKIDMKYEKHEFSTLEEFSKWKSDLEKNTKSIYVKYAGWVSGDNKYSIFQCHRSGKFSPVGKGLRHLKGHGSNKIDAFCPASIRVTGNKKGQYFVSYQVTHVGHQNDLSHLSLSEEEKKLIALKIAAKIPFNKILDEIRDSKSDSGLERLHLLKRKDLQNILRSLKSGKWAEDIELSNESSSKIDVNRNETFNQSSFVCIENMCNESLVDIIGNEVEIASESHLNVIGNEAEIASESHLNIIENAVEISNESPANTKCLKCVRRNEVDLIIKEFTQAILSFQERFSIIENEYLKIIHSASTIEELDILENSLYSLQSNMNAIKLRKSSEVNFTVQPDHRTQ